MGDQQPVPKCDQSPESDQSTMGDQPPWATRPLWVTSLWSDAHRQQSPDFCPLRQSPSRLSLRLFPSECAALHTLDPLNQLTLQPHMEKSFWWSLALP